MSETDRPCICKGKQADCVLCEGWGYVTVEACFACAGKGKHEDGEKCGACRGLGHRVI